MAEHLHYVEYVSGFVVFHSCFEVAKGVEAYLHDSWVLEFLCGGFALSLRARWNNFVKNLTSKEDMEAFEQILDACRNYASAGSNVRDQLFLKLWLYQ